MKNISALLLIFLLACSACGDHSTRQAPPAETPQASTCPQLEKTFNSVNELEALLNSESPQWEPVVNQTRQVVQDIRKNMQKSPDSCLFINHESYPKRERFKFVEDFTEFAIKMNEAEGVSILVQLHSVFKEDPEISEYLSEELGHIASHAPTSYATFFLGQPIRGQRVLEITSWDLSKVKEMTSAYQKIGAEGIVDHLKSLGKSS